MYKSPKFWIFKVDHLEKNTLISFFIFIRLNFMFEFLSYSSDGKESMIRCMFYVEKSNLSEHGIRFRRNPQ